MKKCLLLLLSALALLIFLWLKIDINSEQVTEIPASPVMYDIKGRLFHVRLSQDSQRIIPVPLDEMGKWLPLVAVNAEDGRFFSHIGVDFLSLLRAAAQNVSRFRVVSGASTITAQVVRLSVSEREGRKRTVSTKIREFIMALKLERKLSKSKILECYLNLAPFGGNIRGVQAASLIYFGKTASQISPGEACLLIGMLNGPALYRPDRHPEAAMKRRNEIIALMERKKVFDRSTASRAYLEELPRQKFNLPSRAWHYCELLLSQNPQHSGRYDTTLDIEIQTKLEAILRQSLNDFPSDVTLSAGVVDNKTANLCAWVGNARFSYDSSWVDCGRSPRSPGSTLKPFAYLSAVEQGILTPSTLLADTSIAFSGRAPRNFDLTYRGAVTARTALHESLNAPAVRVLRSAGNDRVLSFMRNAGYAHLTQSPEYYGDSLILGGCEVTLLEQLEAYTALASLGVHRPLKLMRDSVQTSERIATSAGCWIVSDMLKYDGELLLLARATHQKWQVALKTGTSYGLRDAWACAWTPDYTVCVWAGRADGSSWEGLVGARASSPIAIKILRAVSPKSTWYEMPENVIVRKVCSLSGKPPIALCPSTKLEWAVKNVTHTVPCDIHALKGGKVARNMPAGFSIQGGKNLAIISPIPGASYFNAPFDTERKIPLKAEGSKGFVWWYADGKYIGSSKTGETLFTALEDGEHVVSATDGNGKSSAVTVKIFTPGKKSESEKLF